MPVPFTCPHCGAETSVSEEFLGTTGPCARCGQMISIPAAGVASAVAVPAKRSLGPAVIVLVVLAVLGVLVVCGVVALSLAVTAYDGTRRRAYNNAAKVQIALFEDMLALYKMNVRSLPTADQGLEALRTAPADLADPDRWDGPYLATPVPLDPWGNRYQYESPGRHNPDSCDIWSFGPDGLDRTEDDIGNWNEW